MEQKKQREPEKLDLFLLVRNLLKQVRRLWWLVVALAVLGGGLMYLRTVRSYTPMYQSEAIFSVSVDYTGTTDIVSYSHYYDNDAAQLAAESFPYVLGSDVMEERLLLELGTAHLNGSISADAIPGTNFFSLTAKSTSAADAYALVEATLDVYPQVSRFVIGDTQLTITQAPTVATQPYNSLSWKRSTLMGAVAGGAAGFLVLLLLAMANPTVITEADVRKIVNLKCLVQIPNVRRKRRTAGADASLLVTNQEPDSPFNETFRLLRLKLLRDLKNPKDKVILFTSSLPSEGKSSLAINTALTLAKDGKRVLLIDGDLRAQNVKNLLGIDTPSVGLDTHLKRNASELPFLQYRDNSLYLLAGDETVRNPIPLLKHERLRALLRQLREQYDYILIDTPPSAMMADAGILSRHADKVVYVIREDFASRSQILDGVQALSGAGARLCGFVLNRSTLSGDGQGGYGYGYGYSYGRYGYGYKYGSYGKKSGYTRGKEAGGQQS